MCPVPVTAPRSAEAMGSGAGTADGVTGVAGGRGQGVDTGFSCTRCRAALGRGCKKH